MTQYAFWKSYGVKLNNFIKNKDFLIKYIVSFVLIQKK